MYIFGLLAFWIRIRLEKYSHSVDPKPHITPGCAVCRKMHRLSEKQFTWVGVRGRALAQAWSDCEALLVGKSWLGGLKAKVRQANFLYSSPLLVLLPSVVEPEPGHFGWSWSRFKGPAPAPQHWVATPKLVKNTKS